MSCDESIITGLVNSLQISYEDTWKLSSGNIQRLYEKSKGYLENAMAIDGAAMIGQGIEILLGDWLMKIAENNAAKIYRPNYERMQVFQEKRVEV